MDPQKEEELADLFREILDIVGSPKEGKSIFLVDGLTANVQ